MVHWLDENMSTSLSQARAAHGLSLAHALMLSLCGCALGADEELATLGSEGVGLMDAAVPHGASETLDASVRGTEERDDDAGPAGRPQGIVTRWPADWSPDRPAIVSVRANGTGCPNGAAVASIGPDLRTLSVWFNAFEAAVNKHQSLAVKDCQLVIQMSPTENLSYAVSELFYQGYAFLEAGQNAQHLSMIYVQGTPIASEEAPALLVGPYDDIFQYQDAIETDDRVWTPCGAARDLNVRLTLRIQDSAKNEGYLNLATDIDAAIELKLRLKIAVRRCH
jgi:hypothetical protein